jgi:DNA-binding transcriptional regulator GbsR (MarR family)
VSQSELHAYADEIGLFFQEQGLPLMDGRVLGWLMVCEPAHQSAEELAAALQVSRGAISMSMKMLTGAGAVERYKLPGVRRLYYRLRPGFWLREAEDKARLAVQWRDLMERGLTLMAEEHPDRRNRVQEARDMYAFLADEYARIKDVWLARRAEPRQADLHPREEEAR